ncbi:MAG: PKD-like domain-containing protein [Candidatus Methanofastidiosia archaeon]|jgi:hypothetical protein
MKRILILLVFTIGCIAQVPPSVTECTPSDTELIAHEGDAITFSCDVSDTTNNVSYSWYINDEKVADTNQYTFSESEGDYTVLLKISGRGTTISHQWDVMVVKSPDFKKIQERIERIRGLLYKNPVIIVQITRNQMRKNITDGLEEDKEDVTIEQKIYTALHVWDTQQDLYEVYLDVITAQVASYYDSGDHTFYEVVDPGAPLVYREFIASHELIHALQDQYSYLDTEFENDDKALAFLCVVEGDAMVHQFQYLEYMTINERSDLFEYIRTMDVQVVNPFLENLLMLRYDLGYEFVASMSVFGVDALYEDLPESTEQVMHIEKYRAHELPEPVEVPDISGWEQIDHNVLGEAVIMTILKEHIPLFTAAEAAAGWGGDAYGYYEQGDQFILMINTVWDTEKDSKEFYDAYYNFSLSWSNESIENISEGIYKTPTGYLALVRNKTHVIIIESSSLQAVQHALSAA